MVVSGIRAKIIRLGIVTNILLLSVLSVRKPGRWLQLLKDVRKKRSTVQGLSGFKKYIRAQGRYFFSENIPGWPSRAFNGFFKNEIGRILEPDKRGPLSTIIIAITSRCQLACGHCYEWNNISAYEKLTVKDLKGIIGKIKDAGVRHIQLSGGEPLERFEDLLGIVEFASTGADIWLLTSGYGLSNDKALKLKKAGLTGADISLDHWEAEGHNRSRNNPDAFFWVKEAVKSCHDAGLVTSLSLCAFRSFVSSSNLEKYAAIAKEWNVGFIRLLEPRQAGRFVGMDIELKTEQINLLECFYQDANLSDKYLTYPIVTYPGYNQRRSGCFGSGNRYLYIDSKGEIHACPFCQQSAGNAVSSSFEEALSLLRSYGCQKFKMNLSD
ncbi:MAG: radical SAM protein [Bacteroidota bacterium]|nr:radical SAM protein [Bacteroidota bacterium]